MSKKIENNSEMLDHYDFSGGVRGKYAERALKSSHVIVLEADVAEVFTTSESVNQTLRGLLPIIQTQAEKTQQ
jgi:hypothetical protein